MANEVVKFNNDMNTVALRKFNSTEINLLISICSRIRDQGLKYVEFDFKYLKKLIKYPYNDMKNFVNTLDSAYNKLLKCNIRIGDDVEWTRFVLFTKYTINVEKQIVTIGINEEFKYVLNELTSNFTRFELEEFVNFKSTYTKEFYRRMKQFRYTGIWIVSIEEFKYLLDIPQSYKTDKIDSKILKPIMNELGEEFNLKVIKKYKNSLGRGRSKVSGYEFSEFNEIELAYAITVHKSQGSEYPAVIIPVFKGPAMLMNRNLIYTAVTRAKKCVVLVGIPEVFYNMIQNKKEMARYTGLKSKIIELSMLSKED